MQLLRDFRQERTLPEEGGQRVAFLCLLAVAAVELLFFFLEERVGGIAYLYAEHYLTIPAALFLGCALSRKQTPQGKRMLLLSFLVLAWFFISQTGHRILENDGKKIGTFFCAYALFLPFASVTQDGNRQRGLKVIVAVFLATSVLLVVYAGLLIAGALPGYLWEDVCWDGTRFSAMGHPNICATLLMIGMAFTAGGFLFVRNWWGRGALLILLAAQFAAMSLTNGRTTTAFTCLLMGGVVFCALRKTGWKRMLVALLAGTVVMGSLFVLSGRIYSENAKYLQAWTQQTEETAAQTPTVTQQITNPINGQGTWENDIRSLNGRTVIWSCAVKGLQNNPQIPWIGTESVSLTVSQASDRTIIHTHNSWLEAIYRMGLPGLVLALVLTVMAVWDAAVLLWRNDDVWKSCIALLTLCLLGCAILEPYLFVVDVSYHFLDFLFLMCLGYMNLWAKRETKR